MSSRKTRSQQITLSFDEADLTQSRVQPEGASDGLRVFPAQVEMAARESKGAVSLMEQVVGRGNMLDALERVERNKGASGVDAMTVKELRPYLREHWSTLKLALLEGTYRPQPVKRVELPKSDGGKRMLGIPTVLDRLIQQAVLQVLTAHFDPHFSPHSYGFRPGRRGHDAVRRAREYVREGRAWVVDLDLEKFFDRINHDMLMARVARRVKDKQVLVLIRRFLQAGVLMDGVAVSNEEGAPQGGPLSPLLANILLDDFDKELEKRGHCFVRYADDCNIYVGSARSGDRVRRSLTEYLQNRLRLKVNENKSAVDRPWKRKFLGFSMMSHQLRIRLAAQTVKKVKEKIRSLTQRSAAVSMDERIRALNQYLRGWLGYFALAETPSSFTKLDTWLRSRLRMCRWKDWKQPQTRHRKLRSLGLSETAAHRASGSGKKYWRLAHSIALKSAMNLAYWRTQGLIDLGEQYLKIRNAWGTAGCGPACPVV